jgi:TonB family protein
MSTRQVRAPSVRIDDFAITAPLVRRAARGAPPDVAERLEEEWLADLLMRRSNFARLRLALGCYWASRVIAHDFLAAGTAARVSSSQNGVVTLEALGSTPLSRRSAIFILILCMHVALIVAVARSFAVHAIKKPPSVTKGIILPDTPHPAVVPLPPLNLDLQHARWVVPDIPIPVVDVAPTITNPQVTDDAAGAIIGPSATGDSAMAVKRVGGGPGIGFPDTDDYYPAQAIRQREEGAAAVRVCVDEKGRLSADPTLGQSSGYALLDEGALRLAKAGSGHYRSTTENGRPIGDCYSFRVRFRLKQ